MARLIEDYGLIGNARTAALVHRDGSIDWLCLPRFDSPACFAALLGGVENGRWIVAPAEPRARMSRRYLPDTAILETRFETAGGAVTLTDFMPQPPDEHQIDLVRLVRGETGSVKMRTEVLFRFDYGRTVPWVRRRTYGLSAIVGTHHLAPGNHRRGPQLGLSRLLDPRCHVLALCLHLRRLSRGSARLAGMAAARGGRPARGTADHVRAGRRAPSRGERTSLARRLRGQSAGPRRQRRPPPAAARCLRRADGRALRRRDFQAGTERRRLGHAARPARFSRERVDQAGRRAVGSPRPAAAFHAFQGDGVGGVRSRGEIRGMFQT